MWWFERWNSAKQRLNNNVDLNVVQKWHWIKGRKEKPMKIEWFGNFVHLMVSYVWIEWAIHGKWRLFFIQRQLTSWNLLNFSCSPIRCRCCFFFYHLFSHHRLQRILWHSTKWLKGCTPLTYLLCEFFVQCLPFLWTLAMILVSTTSHCWNHPRRVIFCFDIFFLLSIMFCLSLLETLLSQKCMASIWNVYFWKHCTPNAIYEATLRWALNKFANKLTT